MKGLCHRLHGYQAIAWLPSYSMVTMIKHIVLNLSLESKLKCEGVMYWRYLIELSDCAICDIASLKGK